MKNSNKISLIESFAYAFQGIGNTILHERNMQIHCCVSVLVVIFGFILHISLTEWLLCIVLFGLVMSLELVNTALEATVDLVTNERRPLAKKAKDAAAGAVLMSAIMAAVIGGIIFFPKLWAMFFH